MSKQKKNYARGQRISEAYGADLYQYKPRHTPLRAKRKYRFNWIIAAKGPNGKYQSGLTRFKAQCVRFNERLLNKDEYMNKIPTDLIPNLAARRYPTWEYIGDPAQLKPIRGINITHIIWDELKISQCPDPYDSTLSPSEHFKKYYLCNPEVQLENELNLQKALHKTEVKCTVSKSGEVTFN